MTKLQNNKGFTLVELLIVIAIIAILAAVALPVYTAQMESARQAVDQGTVRSAASLAQSDYLLSGATFDMNYQIIVTKVGDVNNVEVQPTSVKDSSGAWVANASNTFAADGHKWSPESKEYIDSSASTALTLTISNGGEITSATY